MQDRGGKLTITPFYNCLPKSHGLCYSKSMETHIAREEIQRCIPHLGIGTIEPIGKGEQNEAFLVNQKLIFLFPKKRSTDWMKPQAALLPELKKYVSAPIPQFLYSSRDSQGNIVCVGYPMLSGEHISREFGQQHPNMGEKPIQELIKFISQISEVPLATARAAGVTEVNRKNDYEHTLAKFRNLPKDDLTPEILNFVEESYATHLGNSENFNYTPVLVHGDLRPQNLLFASHGDLTGILDFGCLAISDPACEIGVAERSWGRKKFLRQFFARYPDMDTENFRRRLDFEKINQRTNAYCFGVRTNREEHKNWAIRELATLANNAPRMEF